MHPVLTSCFCVPLEDSIAQSSRETTEAKEGVEWNDWGYKLPSWADVSMENPKDKRMVLRKLLNFTKFYFEGTEICTFKKKLKTKVYDHSKFNQILHNNLNLSLAKFYLHDGNIFGIPDLKHFSTCNVFTALFFFSPRNVTGDIHVNFRTEKYMQVLQCKGKHR